MWIWVDTIVVAWVTELGSFYHKWRVVWGLLAQASNDVPVDVFTFYQAKIFFVLDKVDVGCVQRLQESCAHLLERTIEEYFFEWIGLWKEVEKCEVGNLFGEAGLQFDWQINGFLLKLVIPNQFESLMVRWFYKFYWHSNNGI